MTVMAIKVETHHLLSVHSKNPSWFSGQILEDAIRGQLGFQVAN
jgi:hypothetical protein